MKAMSHQMEVLGINCNKSFYFCIKKGKAEWENKNNYIFKRTKKILEERNSWLKVDLLSQKDKKRYLINKDTNSALNEVSKYQQDQKLH